MSNERIVVKPEELKAVAQKMETQIADYRKVYNSIFSEVDGLANAWKGADNIENTTQVQGFKEDFEKMANTLEEYAAFLRESANKYQTTQDTIIAEAKKLAN